MTQIPLLQADNIRAENFGPISLSIQHNEKILLTGPSGSGKSRLLKMLADIDPHEGDLFFEGINSSQIVPAEWRRKISFIPADSAWWGETVKEHFFEQPESHWWESFNLSPSCLQWQVDRLSSGEKQRLGLLRACALKPKILLLDEPTSNLDQDNVLRIESFIKNYCQRYNAAYIWVSHDNEQIKRLNAKRLYIEEGQLIRSHNDHLNLD